MHTFRLMNYHSSKCLMWCISYPSKMYIQQENNCEYYKNSCTYIHLYQKQPYELYDHCINRLNWWDHIRQCYPLIHWIINLLLTKDQQVDSSTNWYIYIKRLKLDMLLFGKVLYTSRIQLFKFWPEEGF